ncbi:hypothetical protein GCM10011408_10360 [Dyella caseinilytica]|nr:hypothetical protein GCM10011408_10360 [Dyella caseinilytica]
MRPTATVEEHHNRRMIGMLWSVDIQLELVLRVEHNARWHRDARLVVGGIESGKKGGAATAKQQGNCDQRNADRKRVAVMEARQDIHR